MGALDTVLIVGALGVGAWYIITHKDELFPPPVGPDTEPEPEPEPNGNGNGDGNGGGGNGGGDSGYDCAKACRNCWCKSYSENCGKGCSKCCGASRIASKCGGKGVKSCGGGGGGGGGDSFALQAVDMHSRFSDLVGLGPGRVENYSDLFYPHNERAMRVTLA